MRRIVSAFFSLMVLCSLAVYAAEDIEDVLALTCKTKLERVNYRLGEEAVFVFSLENAEPEDEYLVSWQRTGDDGGVVSGKNPISADAPFMLQTSSREPGFVRIHGELLDSNGSAVKIAGKPLVFEGGAGFAVETLKPALDEPADFDAFWQRQKVRLAAVPLKVDMRKCSEEGAPVEVYFVSIDCVGRPATGYLSIPANASEKSLPAQVLFEGYGVHAPGKPQYTPTGLIVFTLNAHGFDMEKEPEYLDAFKKKIADDGYGYAFNVEENKEPESCYFNGMVLRVLRTLEFVKSLPAWNGEKLVATGGSQGALQAIWACALDSDVTDGQGGMPWCCDIGGAEKGRLPSTFRPAYSPALDYYDAAFHAKRIGDSCRFTVLVAGLGDDLCPAAGIASFYNNIASEKKAIVWKQNTTHYKNPPVAQSYSVTGHIQGE